MPATALLTSEQYLALPEEFDQNGNRIKGELIGGEVVKMPPPSQLHDWIKNRINTQRSGTRIALPFNSRSASDFAIIRFALQFSASTPIDIGLSRRSSA